MTATLDHAHELEQLLLEHNVTVFGYERSDDYAIVRFKMHDKKLRLVVKMPEWSDEKYRLTPTGFERADKPRRDLFWGDVKRTWKAMTDLIRAKLDGIGMGITTFENEFSQFTDAEALIGDGKK